MSASTVHAGGGGNGNATGGGGANWAPHPSSSPGLMGSDGLSSGYGDEAADDDDDVATVSTGVSELIISPEVEGGGGAAAPRENSEQRRKDNVEYLFMLLRDEDPSDEAALQAVQAQVEALVANESDMWKLVNRVLNDRIETGKPVAQRAINVLKGEMGKLNLTYQEPGPVRASEAPQSQVQTRTQTLTPASLPNEPNQTRRLSASSSPSPSPPAPTSAAPPPHAGNTNTATMTGTITGSFSSTLGQGPVAAAAAANQRIPPTSHAADPSAATAAAALPPRRMSATPSSPARPVQAPAPTPVPANAANVVLDRPAPGKVCRLEISRANYEFIARETLKYPRHQTGGELFGLWKTDGTAVVTHVTGPGRHAVLAVNTFEQDKDYRNAVAIMLRQRASVSQIGDWHSHHQLGKKDPSKGDDQNAVARMRARERPWWISIITLVDRGAAEVRGYRYTNAGLSHEMMVHARTEFALNDNVAIGRAITRDDLLRMRDVVADSNPQAEQQHRQLQEQMRARAARAQQQRAMRQDPHHPQLQQQQQPPPQQQQQRAHHVPTAAVAHAHGNGNGNVPVAQAVAVPRERAMLLSRVHGNDYISEEEDRNGVGIAAHVMPQYGGGGGMNMGMRGV